MMATKSPPKRRRTRARELALQCLYQIDLRPDLWAPLADQSPLPREAMEELLDEPDLGLQHDEVAEFTAKLIEGTVHSRDAIDERLRKVTTNWDVKRMAAVDRNVLRMAIYEFTDCDDVPPKVTINEAIELAKRFSTANSGAFVNGILDRIRLDLEKEAADEKGKAPAAPQASSPPPAPAPATKADDPAKSLDCVEPPETSNEIDNSPDTGSIAAQ